MDNSLRMKVCNIVCAEDSCDGREKGECRIHLDLEQAFLADGWQPPATSCQESCTFIGKNCKNLFPDLFTDNMQLNNPNLPTCPHYLLAPVIKREHTPREPMLHWSEHTDCGDRW